jgi:membrane protein DedA with SNARE-associated domain
MGHLLHAFHTLVAHFGYFGLFVVMTLGNMAIPVGTEVVMPTAGGLAGSGHLPALGPIPAWVVVGIVGTLGEVCGGLVLYAIGWYGGLAFVRRYGKYVRFREHELERVSGFYARYGRATVFLTRFVPLVRGIGGLPPGISRMQKRYFISFTALGSAIFCFGFAYAGDVAGRNLPAILTSVHEFGRVILAGVVGCIIVLWVWLRRAGRSADRARSNSAR